MTIILLKTCRLKGIMLGSTAPTVPGLEPAQIWGLLQDPEQKWPTTSAFFVNNDLGRKKEAYDVKNWIIIGYHLKNWKIYLLILKNWKINGLNLINWN